MKKIYVSFVLIVSLFLSAFIFGLSDKTVLRVGDSKLTEKQLAEKIESLPPQYKEYYTTNEGKAVLIDSIKKEFLVYEKAKSNKYDNNKEVLKQLENITKQLMIAQYLKENIEDKIKISNKEMKKYYDDNTELFMKDDQVRARHILVNSEEEASEIINKLSEGASFQVLARENSIDPGSKNNGGDLGWFAKGQMVAPFENAAFSLKKGEYTKMPVKTQFGFHIIKVEDTKEPEEVSFEEAKEEIEMYLKQTAQKEALDKLITEAETSIQVEDFSEQFLLEQ
jgi:peptidyl-prolyl cis-trans isomerase C